MKLKVNGFFMIQEIHLFLLGAVDIRLLHHRFGQSMHKGEFSFSLQPPEIRFVTSREPRGAILSADTPVIICNNLFHIKDHESLLDKVRP